MVVASPSTESTDSWTPTAPKSPKMGGVLRTGETEWVIWTGGKPSADWSGLITKNGDPSNCPNCLFPGPSRASDAQKLADARKKGLEDKFSRKGDYQVFKFAVRDHLVNCGMDTIAYLPDPSDGNKMVSIIKEDSKYTPESAKRLALVQVKLYDKHDTQNNKTANTFLLNSLDPTLRTDLQCIITVDCPFAVVWFHLVSKVKSTSMARFDTLKQELKRITPMQFPGQDISEMVKAV